MEREPFCPNCGLLNEENGKFCKNCGTLLIRQVQSVGGFEPTPNYPYVPPKTMSMFQIILLILGIITALLMLPVFIVDEKLSYFFAVFVLVGLGSLVLSLILLILSLFIERLSVQRRDHIKLLAISIAVFAVGLTAYIVYDENFSKPSMSLAEYERKADDVEYDHLARNADDYVDDPVRIEARVVQLIDGEQQDEILVNMGWNDLIYIERKDDAGNLIVGDYIEVYGIVEGYETYLTVQDVENTVPHIRSEYINILE